MTRERWDVNRRTALLWTACGLSAGLAGCFGGGDDDGDDQQEQTDDEGGDDDEEVALERTDPDELTDEEIAEGFTENILGILNEPDIVGYNELLHSGGELDPVPEDESVIFGPQFEATDPEVLVREDDELVIGMAVQYQMGTDEFDEDWEFEFERDDGEWRLWDVDTGDRLAEPALSPEVTVAEFVDALAAGDASAVDALLFEDGNPPETIVENTEEFEGIIELDGTDVTDRETGRAEITATVLIRHDGGQEQLTWNLVVGAVDGDWQIGFTR